GPRGRSPGLGGGPVADPGNDRGLMPKPLLTRHCQFRFAAFGLLLAALLAAYHDASEAASPLAVHVVNNHLVDANGNVLRLLGVNRSGAEYMCVGGSAVFDGPVDAASLAAIKPC